MRRAAADATEVPWSRTSLLLSRSLVDHHSLHLDQLGNIAVLEISSDARPDSYRDHLNRLKQVPVMSVRK